MQTVYVGIGMPGSGKTTVLQPFAEARGYTYISPDMIREELTGDITDHSQNTKTWQLAYERTREALEQGLSVVFDATFAKVHDRRDFIRHVREWGSVNIVGAYADVSYDIAQSRNLTRTRVVPEHAMKRMWQWLQDAPPSLADGFDSIITLEDLSHGAAG